MLENNSIFITHFTTHLNEWEGFLPPAALSFGLVSSAFEGQFRVNCINELFRSYVGMMEEMSRQKLNWFH